MLKRASGLKYPRFLAQLHANALFDWYLEIGCRTGTTFAPVRSKTIAVDPFFRVETNVIQRKPQLHVFQTTSDDFFASGFLARNGIRLSVAFIDGMHLFEYLLRDFMNTEAGSTPQSVIAIHDCLPFDDAMTVRDHTTRTMKAWTGDVWKLLPILAEYRPDLKVEVLDCHPTGLVLVSNLNPENRDLNAAYDAILARYMDVTLADWGHDRFNDSFELIDARAYRAAGFPAFAGVKLDESLALAPTLVSP